MSSFLWDSPALIEGIGEDTAAALQGAGIATITDLLAAGADVVQQVVPGMSRTRANRWIAAAWLLRVDGVDPQLAEALVEGGIASAAELAGGGLQTLETALRDAEDRGLIEKAPSIYRLAAIQRYAASVRGTGVVIAHVLDKDTEKPIQGARAWVARRSETSDEAGRVAFLDFPEGTRQLLVLTPGGRRFSTTVTVESDALAPRMTLRVGAAQGDGPVTAREADGALISLGRGSRLRIVRGALHELPNDIHLVVRRLPATGEPARLLNLYRSRTDAEITADLVEVPPGLLPPDSEVGDVLHYQGGSLTNTDLTIRDVARLKVERRVGEFPRSVRRRRVKLTLGTQT